MYYSDLAYGDCQDEGGPEHPQGQNRTAPFAEEADVLTARLYLPSCGGNYMTFEFERRDSTVNGKRSKSESRSLPGI